MRFCEREFISKVSGAVRAKTPLVVLLNGEMGAGKTTFVSRVLKSVLPNVVVQSPTFTIINEYAPNVFHADLYRIKSGAELLNTDFFEILYGDNVFFIEWACNNVDEKIYEKCRNVVRLNIEVMGEKKRKYFID
jgi:tRNA threonylcarbamoyladenosine biosynthesis protein TsaE